VAFLDGRRKVKRRLLLLRAKTAVVEKLEEGHGKGFGRSQQGPSRNFFFRWARGLLYGWKGRILSGKAWKRGLSLQVSCEPPPELAKGEERNGKKFRGKRSAEISAGSPLLIKRPAGKGKRERRR